MWEAVQKHMEVKIFQEIRPPRNVPRIFVITVRLSPASSHLHTINHRNADLLCRFSSVYYSLCHHHLWQLCLLLSFPDWKGRDPCVVVACGYLPIEF